MYRLLLLRHAKAGWAPPGTRDFDRPLTPTGRDDAEALGREMKKRSYLPDLVICSSAKRARETWEGVAAAIAPMDTPVVWSDALYSTDATGYLTVVQEAPPCATLLVIGHNPNMEDLAFALPSPAQEPNHRIVSGFPACGLAVIAFDEPLSEVAPGKGRIEAFLDPRRL